MKVASKKRSPTKYKKGYFRYRPQKKYASVAELYRSPEWKAYIADHTRKHDMLMQLNIHNKNKYKRGESDG